MPRELNEIINDIVSNMRSCCNSMTDKSRIAELLGELTDQKNQKAIEYYGKRIIVSDCPLSFDTVGELEAAIRSNSNAVIITHELYKHIKSQTYHWINK